MSVADKFKLEDETFSLEGKITSNTQTANGSTVNVTGKAGIYGKVYLTYNFAANPKADTQGSFTGIGRGLSDEGEANSATRGGVWTRNGHVITIYSLDDVTDGALNFCIETWDLGDDSVKIESSRVKK